VGSHNASELDVDSVGKCVVHLEAGPERRHGGPFGIVHEQDGVRIAHGQARGLDDFSVDLELGVQSLGPLPSHRDVRRPEDGRAHVDSNLPVPTDLDRH
jgi:hypothetical protein